MSAKRVTWQTFVIWVLCVLMVAQGSPLFALQEGVVNVRPVMPDWLLEIVPDWPTALWQSAPSTPPSAPSGSGGGAAPDVKSSAAQVSVDGQATPWRTLPSTAILAHPGAREVTPRPVPRQPTRRFIKGRREAGTAHNPRERLPEGAQSKVEPRAEIPTKGIPSALLSLVEELHRSPSEIFAYVHDHFDYDPRWGAAKPPLQTLREKRGTAWELTWLLRDLLAAVGIDARFEWGEIELSPKGLESIAGIDDVYRAADLIATGGTPIRLIVEDDEVVAAQMRHVWLLAYLDYVPNRGRWGGEPDYWVRMGPTFKRYEVQEGARLDDAVPFALGEYLQSGSELSPRGVYEEALGAHLSQNAIGVDTVDDVKRDRTPLKEDFVFVPGSLRGYVRIVEGASTGIPAKFVNRLELRLSEIGGSDLLTWSTALAALYAEPLEIVWAGASSADQAALDLNGGVFATPPYEVELAPKLRLGDAEVETGGAVGSASDVLLTAVVTSPDGEPITTEFAMFAGEHAVLAADLGLMPQEVVDHYARRQSEATDATEIERWTLAHASARYLHELGETNVHLAGLRWQRLVNLGNVALAVQRGAVSRSPDGTPLTFSPAPPALDLGAMALALFPPTGDPASELSTVGTMELVGSQASMLEAEVWTEVLGGEHVSAVSALTRAVREGQSLTRVDSTNLDAALSAAELSAEAEASVEIGVGQGRIAWIPESQIRVGTWDVTGYVLENPTTGAAGYLATYERVLEPLDANLVIHSPTDLGVITAPTDVVATIEGEAVDSWTLSTRPAGGDSATEIARGSGPISNAVAGQFDPTLLLNGMHELVLTARDRTGRSATQKITLSVEGTMKIGAFTLSFVDLVIPLSGLDLEIVRTYDSRDKVQKDFGIGWTLDVRQGSYRNNRPPGDGWQIVSSGPPTSFPCAGSAETQAHLTTLKVSEREIYRFRAKVVETSPGVGRCDGRVIFEFVDGPLPATLEVLGNDQVFYLNNAVNDQLIDTDTLAVFEPDTVRLQTPDGRVFELDLDLGIRRIEDANGNRLDISAAGITHSDGLEIAFERDTEGRITRIADPLGQTLDYTYGAAGDLVAFSDRDSATSRYTYDEDHRLLEIEDPRGVTPVRNEYDTDGRLVRTTDAFGETTELGHDLDARREVITDRLGATRIFEYDGAGNIVREIDAEGGITRRAFDARGNLLSTIDPEGGVTTSEYSAIGQLIRRVDPNGGVSEYGYDASGNLTTYMDRRGNTLVSTFDDGNNLLSTTTALGHTVTNTYDGRGNLLSRTDSLGHPEVFEYDSQGRPVRHVDQLGHETLATFDALGNRTHETRRRTLADGTVVAETWSWTYDALDRVLSATAPDGTTTTSSWDLLGNLLQSTDPLGRTTTNTYDLLGRQVSTTYPDGTTERRGYDAEGRITSRTDRAGRITSTTYDRNGRAVATTYPDGAIERQTWDLAGRLVAVTDGRGATTTYGYDAAGHQVRITDPLGHTTETTYDANGNRLAVTDSLGRVTSFLYDAGDRLVRIDHPDGTNTSMTYDGEGRQVASTDAEGRTTRVAYDALGQITTVTNPLDETTAYAWDEAGNRIAQIDAAGKTTRFEYDPHGRLLARILPDGSVERRTYQADGLLASHLDFSGRLTTFEHDLAGRLTHRRLPDGTTHRFTYSPTGKRLSASAPGGTTVWAYDARDRPVSKVDPAGRELRHTWNAAGQRTSLEVRAGGSTWTTSYAWDPAGRLATVTDPLGGVTTHSYDPVGNRTDLAHPNGVATSTAFDALNRLTELHIQTSGGQTASGQTASGATLYLDRYTLDASGRRAQVEGADGSVRAFTYDAAFRLLTERVELGGNLLREEVLTYDPVGNRATRSLDTGSGPTLTASAYDARDRLLSAGATTFGWDSRGRMISRSEGTASEVYTWNDLDRLRSIRLADGTTLRTEYDIDGNRVAREIESPSGQLARQEFLVDDSGRLAHVVAEMDAAGLVGTLYIRGDELLSLIRPGTEEQRFYHADGLGSVRALTDPTGATTDTYTYSAWGELLDHEGDDIQPYRFTGEPFDAVAGLAYHRARWLDPSQGRFLSTDPFAGRIQDPASLHKYLYAHADPIHQVDPTGRFSVASTLTAGGIMNIISSATGILSTAFRIYRAAEIVRDVIDYSILIHRIIRALAAPTPAGAQAAFLGELSNVLTPDAISVLGNSFAQMADILGPNWEKVSRAIWSHAGIIGGQSAAAITSHIPKWLKLERQGRLKFVIFAPSGPIERTAEIPIKVNRKTELSLAVGGGRLFGFGVRTSKKNVVQVFRIDYWENRELNLHYHIHEFAGRGKGITIWKP